MIKMSITISTMSLIGIILGILSIAVIIVTIILEHEDLIGDKTHDFLKIITSFVLVFSICMTVIGIDKQIHKLNDDETIMTIRPTMIEEPIKDGDEVYIYGYKEDGSLYEGSGETEYTVYSTDWHTIKVKCKSNKAKDLMKMSRECDIEVKKAD